MNITNVICTHDCSDGQSMWELKNQESISFRLSDVFIRYIIRLSLECTWEFTINILDYPQGAQAERYCIYRRARPLRRTD